MREICTYGSVGGLGEQSPRSTRQPQVGGTPKSKPCKGWPISTQSATPSGFGWWLGRLPGVDTPGWINFALRAREGTSPSPTYEPNSVRCLKTKRAAPRRSGSIGRRVNRGSDLDDVA